MASSRHCLLKRDTDIYRLALPAYAMEISIAVLPDLQLPLLAVQRNGLNDTGALIKPTSGSNGNLGFSVAVDQLQYSYSQQNHKKTTSYWPQLFAFTQGIAGNGALPRSKFVFDAVELSEVRPSAYRIFESTA